jgi:hypothetical protein
MGVDSARRSRAAWVLIPFFDDGWCDALTYVERAREKKSQSRVSSHAKMDLQ